MAYRTARLLPLSGIGSFPGMPSQEPCTVPVPHCPACGADSPVDPALVLVDRWQGVPGTYRYQRCLKCGSVYQSPRVADDDLPLLYPAGYYTHEAPPPAATPGGRTGLSGALRAHLRRRLQPILRGERRPPPLLHPYRLLLRSRSVREKLFWGLPEPAHPDRPSPGAALEIGPGRGWDLTLLARSGWGAMGFEWDPEATAVARATSGVPVFQGDFRTADDPAGPFRLIYLCHVFEHLSDPLGALLWMARRLAPDGRIVLIVPNPDADDAERYGDRWTGWDPPRHLLLPSSLGFEALAHRTELRVEVRGRAPWGRFTSGAFPPDPGGASSLPPSPERSRGGGSAASPPRTPELEVVFRPVQAG